MVIYIQIPQEKKQTIMQSVKLSNNLFCVLQCPALSPYTRQFFLTSRQTDQEVRPDIGHIDEDS